MTKGKNQPKRLFFDQLTSNSKTPAQNKFFYSSSNVPVKKVEKPFMHIQIKIIVFLECGGLGFGLRSQQTVAFQGMEKEESF